MDIAQWGFDALPKEIKQLIFSFTDLDLATVLKLQSVSSEFKKLCWAWMTNFDTSLLADKERTASVAAYFITRVVSTRIRQINLSKYDNPLKAAIVLSKKFPNLESVDFGHIDEMELPLHDLSEFPAFEELSRSHPTLCEVSLTTRNYFGTWSNLRLRCVLTLTHKNCFQSFFALHSGNGLRMVSTFNAIKEDTSFMQQKPVHFNMAFTRGGTIGENMIVIGATDGTLTFLTRDTFNNCLIAKATNNNVHKMPINAVWDEHTTLTFIASSDGIVSSWSCVDDQPVLSKTYQFPESIFFVCDHASKYLLAAGKRTLYIADIVTMKIVRVLGINDDITGLHRTPIEAILTTKNCLYTLSGHVIGDEALQFIAQIPCPNLSLSPDGSLGVSVKSRKIELFDVATNQDVFTFDRFGNFDTRPHLARFSPSRHLLTVSNGPSLLTFELDSDRIIATISPRLSRKEMKESLPNCNALWYSRCGRFLFGLYSNNALYWWHMP